MNKKERDKKERRVVSARAWAEQKDEGRGSYNTPEGMSFWKPSEGTALFDILPYEIVTEGKNPMRIDGEPLPAGSLFHVRRIYNHWAEVPGGKACFNCGKTFGTKCAVCDFIRQLAADPDADEALIKSMKVKTRELYLVYDRNDVEKGLQLWDVSPFAFGDLLKERIEDNDSYDLFADPEQGLTLKVKFKKTPFGSGGTFMKALIIDFVPRKKPLPEDIVNHGVDLDELPKEQSYSEVKAALTGTAGGGDEEEEEEEAPPSKNGKAKHTEQFECDAGDTVSFEYKGRTRTGTVRKVRAKDNIIEVVCEDRSVPYNVNLDDPSLEMAEPEEDEDEDERDEEEEEEAPVAKKKAPAKAAAGKKSAKTDEEEEEEEDDDDAWDDD